jgi:aspartyl/asparaginyl-tRNA synthetase
MISRVLAADLSKQVGSQVRIAGWVHRRRQLKSITFIVIRGRSGLAQVVLTEPEAAATRCSGPNRTTLRATLLNTPVWTPNSAASPTTAT